MRELNAPETVVSRHGKKISVSHRGGIMVRTGNYSLALDPRRAIKSDYSFVSHAHIDHVHTPDGKSRLLASKETVELAKVRGYNLKGAIDELSGIDFVDAGHILGSRAILIEDSVFYTGDFSTRDRGFLKGSPGVKCDTMIMETTYGSPKYTFTETDQIVSRVSSVI